LDQGSHAAQGERGWGSPMVRLDVEEAKGSARWCSQWWRRRLVAGVNLDYACSRRVEIGVSRVHQFGARMSEKVCSFRNQRGDGGPKSEELRRRPMSFGAQAWTLGCSESVWGGGGRSA
jgi:hypothetical protein